MTKQKRNLVHQESNPSHLPEATIALADYVACSRNYNAHSEAQIAKLRTSLRKFGQVKNIVVWRNMFVAGHGLAQAAAAEGWQTLRANVIPDEWPEPRVLAYLAADNELARQSDPDQAALAALIDEVAQYDPELMQAIGYDEAEFAALLAEVGSTGSPTETPDPGPQTDRAEELQDKWQVSDGDLWRIGEHFAICGDCREPETWRRLLQAAGIDKVNGVFTSPPYAMQRKDQYGGVPTAEYVDWWEALQANVKANLVPDGSFFVNIKAHCEDGQRVLYCMDLVCAMVRRWGWLFVDELIWRNTKNGVPGTWPNRLKNAFEPVYHFSVGTAIKFNPKDVGSVTDGAFDYHPLNQKSTTDTPFTGAYKHLGYHEGVSLPSNIIEIAAEGAGIHQAPFPVALPDFFIRAYSDDGDVWCDPFLGSGTTIVAAHQNKRIGIGSERLPKYMAVILERLQEVVGLQPERII